MAARRADERSATNFDRDLISQPRITETVADPCGCCDRRSVLEATLGLGLGVAGFAGAAAAEDPAAMRPQPGDQLVFATGDRKGQVVTVDLLPTGGPQSLAFPYEAAGKLTRNRSRLSQVVVIRLDPASLTEETRQAAAEGVVAYSAVCTHQGCPVSMWDAEKAAMVCSCHATQFDPKNFANVAWGPAPRRLASLPLRVEENILVVAGEFQGRVGFK